MKVNNAIPHSIRQLINSIKRHHGDCETWLRAYSNDCNYTYFGYKLEISVLKSSYGAVGIPSFIAALTLLLITSKKRYQLKKYNMNSQIVSDEKFVDELFKSYTKVLCGMQKTGKIDRKSFFAKRGKMLEVSLNIKASLRSNSLY